MIRQAADIVVGFDDSSVAGARFDHVGINGALCQEVDLADLLGLLLKDADELLADDLALLLRLTDAGQFAQEAVLGVDPDKVDVAVAKDSLDLVALIFAHQAVVDKDAGELAADCFGEQLCNNRAVYAAGQRQQHLAVADLLAYLRDGGVAIVLHAPVAVGAADVVQEVAQHLAAVFGVLNLRVILEAEDLSIQILHGGYRAVLGVGDADKALRQLVDIVDVAHPGDSLLRQVLEERGGGVKVGDGLAEFAGRRSLHLAAQGVGDQLAAVAQAQYRDAQRKDLRINFGRIFSVDAVRATGED